MYAMTTTDRITYPEIRPVKITVEQAKQELLLEILKNHETFRIVKWEVRPHSRKLCVIVRCTYEV